jgi:hypothetical protein
LFFGGWNGPIPVTKLLGLTAEHGPVFAWIGNLLGLLNFVLKCIFGVTFMVWVRWTLPRLRIDQVMQVCLKYCTPIAAVMFLGATVWTFMLPGGGGLRSMPYAKRYVLNAPAAEAKPKAPAKNVAANSGPAMNDVIAVTQTAPGGE